MKNSLLVGLSILLILLPATGEAQFLVPGDNMTLDGIPPIPTAIAADAGRYGQYRSASFANGILNDLKCLSGHGSVTRRRYTASLLLAHPVSN